MTQRPLVFVNIQIARLAAAIFVLLHHTVHQVTERRVPGITGYTDYLQFDGTTGVDIFFVISGFIMIVTSVDRFGSRTNAATFLKRRLSRIVPLYWIFTALMVVAVFAFSDKIAHTDLDLRYLAASLLFIPAANSIGQIQPVLLLGWTLNYEMVFYVIFASAMLLPKRAGIATIFAVIVAMAMVGIGGHAGAPAPIIFWTRPIMIEFLFGIVVGLLVLRRKPISPVLAVTLILVSFAALWLASAAGWTNSSWRFAAAGLPAAGLIAGAALGPQGGQGPLVRLLRLGGDASYALYLSHPFVINALALLWRHVPISSSYAYIAATTVAALAVAIAVHLMVERPILDMLHRRPIALMQHPLTLFLTGRGERHSRS